MNSHGGLKKKPPSTSKRWHHTHGNYCCKINAFI
jgi:hypothetical protein